ncbi:MAG TPA: energy transducer TonB [Vicinamibacterales bacterium]|nr:energy transducer TonB [Vicinamibacterales bacterium]
MAKVAQPQFEESRTAPLHLSDRPVELRFGFEQRRSGVGVGASMAAHLAFALAVLLAIRFAPQPAALELLPDTTINDIVWLDVPGPGGGGGGGGNKMPDPPKKAELPGKEKITVPVKEEPKPTPEPPKPDPPKEELTIPAKTMAAAENTLPGVITPSAPTESQGSGTDGGAGAGKGTGIGAGQGTGLGPGYGGGTGGGAFRPGAGITMPQIVREVKPAYTADAMRAKVQGSVWLECIVMPDGTVGDVKVTRSLDPIFGLDQEAIKAAKQWRFKPGMRQGEPVPVIITIELTFTLR